MRGHKARGQGMLEFVFSRKCSQNTTRKCSQNKQQVFAQTIPNFPRNSGVLQNKKRKKKKKTSSLEEIGNIFNKNKKNVSKIFSEIPGVLQDK